MNVYVATWLQNIDFAAGNVDFAKLVASMLVTPIFEATGSVGSTIEGTGDVSKTLDGTPDLDC